jgi:hypothetical protein
MRMQLHVELIIMHQTKGWMIKWTDEGLDLQIAWNRILTVLSRKYWMLVL